MNEKWSEKIDSAFAHAFPIMGFQLKSSDRNNDKNMSL